MADFKYDVFISYSHKDKTWVRGTLLPKFKERGLKVWIDFENLPVGAPVLTTIEKALGASRKVCLIFTEDYLKSEWTEFENLLPQTAHPTNKELQIVPVLLKKCELPPRFGALYYVNFVDKDEFIDPWQKLFAALDVTETSKPNTSTHDAGTRNDWHLAHPYPMPPHFTGRVDERKMLVDWLNKDNENHLFILRALGGFGKSALSWHWLTHDVDSKEWPKVLWWSFYEGDARLTATLSNKSIMSWKFLTTVCRNMNRNY